MNGWELRERRQREGLTLRAVARATGTAETNLSAYERGAKPPNGRTIRRVVATLDAGKDSPIFTAQLMTAPAAAAAIRRGLRQGWRTADLLRVIREMRTNARHIRTGADQAAFLAEPSTTGDPRWDAMLAGNSEDLAMTMGIDAPTWTQGHVLPEFWFVGSMPELHAYAFGYSPFSMQIRGVMVDPSDLESV